MNKYETYNFKGKDIKGFNPKIRKKIDIYLRIEELEKENEELRDENTIYKLSAKSTPEYATLSYHYKDLEKENEQLKDDLERSEKVVEKQLERIEKIENEKHDNLVNWGNDLQKQLKSCNKTYKSIKQIIPNFSESTTLYGNIEKIVIRNKELIQVNEKLKNIESDNKRHFSYLLDIQEIVNKDTKTSKLYDLCTIDDIKGIKAKANKWDKLINKFPENMQEDIENIIIVKNVFSSITHNFRRFECFLDVLINEEKTPELKIELEMPKGMYYHKWYCGLKNDYCCFRNLGKICSADRNCKYKTSEKPLDKKEIFIKDPEIPISLRRKKKPKFISIVKHILGFGVK